MKKIIVLASSSPRRNEILKNSHLNFKIVKPYMKEITSGKNISSLVIYNAKRKAEYALKKKEKGLILGVDTLVLFKNKIIGKPSSKREAEILLKKFNGKRLSVYTGIYLIDTERDIRVSDYDRTTIYVRKFDTKKVHKYLEYLGPFDKAGGFSIDSIGAVLFDNIKGSYFNVLGLPLRKLALLLERIDLDIFDFIKR